MTDGKRHYVMVTGFDTYESDIPRVRGCLKKEFSKFGPITKLFVEDTLKYAKIYFGSSDICDRAVKELRRNHFGWKLSYRPELEPRIPNYLGSKKTDTPKSHLSSRENFSPDENTIMGDYLEEEFSLNCDYCNVHGQPLAVLESDTGELYVSLRDIKQTGFALFRRDTFDSILVNKNQIYKEFDLHLLSEAKNYILKNRVNYIDEEQILQTIERCKNRLLGNTRESVNDQQSIITRSVHQSDQNLEVIFKNDIGQNQREPSNYDLPPRNRPPHTSSNNFMPSNANTSNFKQNVGRNNDTNGDFVTGEFNKDESHRGVSKRGGPKGREFNDSGFTKNVSNKTDFSKKPNPTRNVTKHDSNRVDLNKKFNKGSEEVTNIKTISLDTSEGGQSNRKHDQSSTTTTGSSQMAITKDKMTVGNTYDVKICYCEPEQENICWVHKVESLDLCDQLLIDISEMEPNAEKVSNPYQGQIVLGEFEGVWYRAEVMNPTSKLLQFIDYGNQSTVDSIKCISDTLKTIPALALKVVINRNEEKLNEGDILSLTVKQQNDDGTFLVESVESSSALKKDSTTTNIRNSELLDENPKPCSSPIKETEKIPQRKVARVDVPKIYCVTPEPLTTVKDGDEVMFVGKNGNMFALKTKECINKNKELISYIKELDKSVLVMNTVREGQLVLCSKEAHTGLCRSVVKEVRQSNVVSVKYVDYFGEDVLTVKSLRNVDEYLAKQPAALLVSPEIPYLENLDIVATNFITELIGRKEKAIVVGSQDKMDFQLENGQLLSEILSDKSLASNKINVPLKQPIPEIPAEEIKTTITSTEKSKISPETTINKEPQSDGTVLYDDMDWIKLTPGEYDFICYHLKDARDITLISTLDEHVKYVEAVSDLQDPDNEPYNPEVFEMCLVHYTSPDETEGFWYRGVVVDVEGNDYNVMMVDFGNETTVTCDKLRKFPLHLKLIPILGLACDFADIPNTPEVNAKLKELIQDSQNFQATIKDFNENTLKYIIGIPKVQQELKDTGLY